MSDLPTPETDAAERMAYGQEYMVPTEVARRLELERNGARELAQALHNDQVTLLLERDEAREAAKGVDSHHDGREAIKHAKRLEQKLIEAREHYENEIGKLIKRLNKSIYRREQAERERDEAREENKKLREALEWIAEQYDDSKPTHQVAMDAYEMSCTAKAALRKEAAK